MAALTQDMRAILTTHWAAIDELKASKARTLTLIDKIRQVAATTTEQLRTGITSIDE
jgi:hypothetical protein